MSDSLTPQPLAVGSSALLASCLVVGGRLSIADEYIATISAVEPDRVHLVSDKFTGWVAKNELNLVPA
jgi:hypothetical protein